MSGMAQIEVSLDTWKAIEAARLSLGETHDDIVRRVLAIKHSAARSALRVVARQSAPATRRRGDISVELFGRTEPVANLKAAYIAVLTSLVRHKPSLFALLSDHGTRRRRWIAREATTLFPGSPHLARDHAHPLPGEWWLDTNVSRAQIDQRLEKACALAGYRYGADLRIAGA